MNIIKFTDYIERIVKYIPNVNSFTKEDIYQVWNSTEVKFSSVAVGLKNVVYNQGNSTFSLLLYYADRLTENKSNKEEIWQQSFDVVTHIVGKLQDNENIDVNQNFNIQFFEQKFADELAGCYVELQVNTFCDLNACGFDGDIPDEPVIVNQPNKDVNITENGVVVVKADYPYEGLDKVTITTNIPPNVETKSIKITKNGMTTVVPSEGVDGISKLNITTDVWTLPEAPSDGVQYDRKDKNWVRAVGQTTAEGGEIFNKYENDEYKSANKATGEFSHAEGDGTTASGPSSHTEGSVTVATSQGAHSEGIQTKAYGTASHAGGFFSVAGEEHPQPGPPWTNGIQFAHGYYCKALGPCSAAFGYMCETTNSSEFAVGTINKSNPGTQFSVGVGSGNAFEVLYDGKVYVKDVNGYDGTNPEATNDLKSKFDSIDAAIAVPPGGYMRNAIESVGIRFGGDGMYHIYGKDFEGEAGPWTVEEAEASWGVGPRGLQAGAYADTGIYFNYPVDIHSPNLTTPKDLSACFLRCKKLRYFQCVYPYNAFASAYAVRPTNMYLIFSKCSNLESVQFINMNKCVNTTNAFQECGKLKTCKLLNLKCDVSFEDSPNLTVEDNYTEVGDKKTPTGSSLAIIINTASKEIPVESPITIALHPSAYDRIINDSTNDLINKALAKNIRIVAAPAA